MKIDIYNYPDRATSRELLAYRIAVEQAALDGKLIEVADHGDDYWVPFVSRPGLPGFFWDQRRYRVSRPGPAAGHNPENFTEDQVEVKDGWRLLTAEEMRGPQQPGVQYWHRGEKVWAGIDEDVLSTHHHANTYRTKAAPGEYLPKRIAQGHNPAGLTEDQIPAGWRLFSKEEKAELGEKSIKEYTRYWMAPFWSAPVPFCVLFDEPCGTLITDSSEGYFLPKPKIAQGHNPAGLTEDQVGVAEGWRLLAPDEIGEHKKDDKPGEIQRWYSSNGAGWQMSGGNHGWESSQTYRTKAAPGRFRKPSLKPWTLDTVPLPCVLRSRGLLQPYRYGVLLADHEGLYIGTSDEAVYSPHRCVRWATLLEEFEYSLDHGKTWHRCGTDTP